MPSSSPEKENALWTMFLSPFIHLLDPKSCETFGAFECCITDKDIEPASTEAADTIAELLHQLSATDLKLKPKCSWLVRPSTDVCNKWNVGNRGFITGMSTRLIYS